MKVFLIDFENVKSKGLTGIEKLESEDTVVILYSENSDTISFEMHQKVISCKAEIEYFKVNVGGKNALDFQLSTLLGYIVARDAFTHAFIISNDRGFDFLHDFWHGHFVENIHTVVYRTRTISQALSYALGSNQAKVEEQEPDEVTELESAQLPAEAEPQEEAVTAPQISQAQEERHTAKPTSKRPRGYMPNLTHILQEVCTDEQIREISRLLSESETKEELHNSLAKIYKQQATDFYKLIRPRYLRLKQLYLKENPEKTDARDEKLPASQEQPSDVTGGDNKDKLTELIEGIIDSSYLNDTQRVAKCIHSAQTKQQLYIRTVKEFGKELGCSIYKSIKGSCDDLLAAAREAEE